ncbi:MAG: hypothetical protein E7600_02035 [Ruminococcaceae bacterium]|nr:hypothetical protein [Oscillospiraceae bacterium]
MTKFLKYISLHIPETICLFITFIMLLAYSICAVVLETKAKNSINNPLENIETANFAEIETDVTDSNEKNEEEQYEPKAVSSITVNNAESVDKTSEILQTEEKSESNTEAAASYCIIGNGKKYHKTTCSYIKEDSKCTPITPEEALKDGYEPCSRCIK